MMLMPGRVNTHANEASRGAHPSRRACFHRHVAARVSRSLSVYVIMREPQCESRI